MWMLTDFIISHFSFWSFAVVTGDFSSLLRALLFQQDWLALLAGGSQVASAGMEEKAEVKMVLSPSRPPGPHFRGPLSPAE